MVLYNALTGKTYFSASEIKDLARQLTRSVRISNDGKMKGIKPEVAEIIDKMIKREPERRYQTFVEVERDILAVLASEYC